MLNDRGTKKWTALMLPEHVALLKKVWSEDKAINRPILDSQELEMMNRQLGQAYELRISVKLTVYAVGLVEEYCGIVSKVSNNDVYLQLQDGTKIIVAFYDILSIQQLNSSE